MTTFTIRDERFVHAVRSIERRAERQIDDLKLVRLFVPNRVLDELETNQNQLVFGRRGVGKTHTLKAYLSRKVEQGSLCHYIDCTSFGSGLSADDTPQNVAVRFFAKFMSALSDQLLDDAARTEAPPAGLHDDLERILCDLARLAQPRSNGETFAYGEIVRTVNRFADRLGTERLFLLIDEWAQIPVPARISRSS